MGQGKNEGIFASTDSSLCFCLKNYKFVPKQNKMYQILICFLTPMNKIAIVGRKNNKMKLHESD